MASEPAAISAGPTAAQWQSSAALWLVSWSSLHLLDQRGASAGMRLNAHRNRRLHPGWLNVHPARRAGIPDNPDGWLRRRRRTRARAQPTHGNHRPDEHEEPDPSRNSRHQRRTGGSRMASRHVEARPVASDRPVVSSRGVASPRRVACRWEDGACLVGGTAAFAGSVDCSHRSRSRHGGTVGNSAGLFGRACGSHGRHRCQHQSPQLTDPGSGTESAASA
jgi:hypothetical protein